MMGRPINSRVLGSSECHWKDQWTRKSERSEVQRYFDHFLTSVVALKVCWRSEAFLKPFLSPARARRGFWTVTTVKNSNKFDENTSKTIFLTGRAHGRLRLEDRSKSEFSIETSLFLPLENFYAGSLMRTGKLFFFFSGRTKGSGLACQDVRGLAVFKVPLWRASLEHGHTSTGYCC